MKAHSGELDTVGAVLNHYADKLAKTYNKHGDDYTTEEFEKYMSILGVVCWNKINSLKG